jgi:teichuronic acid biosynthesis glycosyltransferase TuaH
VATAGSGSTQNLHQSLMADLDTSTRLGKVVLISPERWDDVWRRNQHLAARLPALGLADHVTFVNPADRSGGDEYSPVPGVTVISPRRLVPKRLGGLRMVARSLRRTRAHHCDTLWVNDPTTGAYLLGHARATYDVTDDWRTFHLTPRERRRMVAAEDVLARRARTVVCSEELRRRWQERYDVDAVIVNNAVDVAGIRRASPVDLGAEGPHVGYIGTLHDARLDVTLVLQTADAMPASHLHLVGPDSLSEASRHSLSSRPNITLHGKIPASDVPSWLVAFDVLICPHVVTPFTLSLDAIKAYEYLATSRPVVATPTSGFQVLEAPGLTVTADGFVGAVRRAAELSGDFHRQVPNWDDRARQFAEALAGVGSHG